MADDHALAGAYALGALDEAEGAAFARHLARCAPCRLEADELRATAARLADATWSVPPPRLRTDVLERTAATRQQRPRHREGRAGWAVSRWRRIAAAAGILATAAGILATAAGILTAAGIRGSRNPSGPASAPNPGCDQPSGPLQVDAPATRDRPGPFRVPAATPGSFSTRRAIRSAPRSESSMSAHLGKGI